MIQPLAFHLLSSTRVGVLTPMRLTSSSSWVCVKEGLSWSKRGTLT
ncbi:MAG: hypothetical protein PUC85_07725 [bacterium]|nr:hypothetical protein [bacterium]